jgi:hypothetical protein
MMRLFAIAALLCSSTALALPVSISGARAAGGTVRLDDERGRVVAITLMSRYTSDELQRINRALESEAASDVRIVTVVDFIGIPRLFHEVARARVAAAAIDPAIEVVVDDSGSWRARLGAAPDKRVDIIVLDRSGELRGHFVGLAQVDDARRLIRDLSTR